MFDDRSGCLFLEEISAQFSFLGDLGILQGHGAFL